MTLRIQYGIVCEDVRREDNGKLIAIGIYGSDIGVSSIPAALQLALLLAVETNQIGQTSFHLEAYLGDTRLLRATIVAHITRIGVSLVPITGMIFPKLEKEGPLKFLWRSEESDELKPLVSLPLVKRDTPMSVQI